MCGYHLSKTTCARPGLEEALELGFREAAEPDPVVPDYDATRTVKERKQQSYDTEQRGHAVAHEFTVRGRPRTAEASPGTAA